MSEHPPRSAPKSETTEERENRLAKLGVREIYPADKDGNEMRPPRIDAEPGATAGVSQTNAAPNFTISEHEGLVPPVNAAAIPKPADAPDLRWWKAPTSNGSNRAPEKPIPGNASDMRTGDIDAAPDLREMRQQPLQSMETGLSPSEWRESLKGRLGRAVTEVQQALAVQAEVGGERAAMLQAEREYLTAFKEINKRGFLGKRFGQEAREVDELKRAYAQSRATYGNALVQSVQRRLTNENVPAEKQEKILARYNRLVRYNEVTKPVAELRIRARQEGLNEKEKGVFLRGLEYFGAGNRRLEQKLGKPGALITRSLIGATIMTGGAAALGFVGTASVIGLAGYGGFKFLRGLGSAVLFGTVGGGGAARLYEKKLGGEKDMQNAAEQLKSEGRNTSKELTSEQLDALDASREKLADKASGVTLQKRKMWIRTLTALGLGGLTSLATFELGTLDHATAVATQTGGGPSLDQATVKSSAAETFSNSRGPLTLPGEEQVPVSGPHAIDLSKGELPKPEDIVVEHPQGVHVEHPDSLKVSIDRPGEGADQAFRELQHKLTEAGVADKYPEIMKMSPHELSQHYGFADDKNLSGYMHANDSFELNGDGKIVFTPHDGPHAGVATVLEDKDSFRTAGGTYQPEHAAAPEQAPELAQEQTPTPTPRPDTLDGQRGAAEYRAVHGPVESGPVPPVHEPAPGERVADHSNVSESSSHENHSIQDDESTHPRWTNEYKAPVSGAMSAAAPSVPENMQSYESYQSVSMEKLLDPATQMPAPLHERLIEMIKHTGVGPAATEAHQETVAEYLHRVADSHSVRTGFAEGYRGLKIPLSETHVYSVGNKVPVVFGGDAQARMFVMGDYFMHHPDTKNMLMESYDTAGHARTVPWSLVNGHPTPGLPVRDTFLGFGGFADGPDPKSFKSILS